MDGAVGMIIAAMVLGPTILAGAVGYVLLFWLPFWPRAIGSCIAACVPSYIRLAYGTVPWPAGEAAREAFASRRAVAVLIIWAVILASYRVIRSQWRRPDSSTDG